MVAEHDHLASKPGLQISLSDIKYFTGVWLDLPGNLHHIAFVLGGSVQHIHRFIEVPRAEEEELVVLLVDVIDLFRLQGGHHSLLPSSGF